MEHVIFGIFEKQEEIAARHKAAVKTLDCLKVDLEAEDIQAAIAAYVSAETGREVDASSVALPEGVSATATVGDASTTTAKAGKQTPAKSKPKAKATGKPATVDEVIPDENPKPEPEAETPAEEPAVEVTAEQAEEPAEAPAAKPVSIFSFDKKKNA